MLLRQDVPQKVRHRRDDSGLQRRKPEVGDLELARVGRVADVEVSLHPRRHDPAFGNEQLDVSAIDDDHPSARSVLPHGRSPAPAAPGGKRPSRRSKIRSPPPTTSLGSTDRPRTRRVGSRPSRRASRAVSISSSTPRAMRWAETAYVFPGSGKKRGRGSRRLASRLTPYA